ncbi:MotA/TolQ/ExbB proton channel family protein [Pedobacter sp. MR22-3]|uniref:MotA/TolQ/ExbB proton channel family protein n=1 Tax=Pedobacter sp. MR22-3 TaxID=2994552 RepID=UPI0022455478|nr:MotA/TolQ/ExbB proton channel family protein [Pedobacter sp. MR22-3]MCX2584363.1 MotA/TolQ/ExbB proton channel family protein [Pedobacter sp. MR22-3]
MDILKTLESLLYLLSNFFIYPVLVGLFLLFASQIFSLGLFASESLRRIRNKEWFVQAFRQKINRLSSTDEQVLEIELQHVLEQAQRQSLKQIQWARYAVKIGPTLGLIGTLTPMAKALSGLSQGNLSSLSSQMITAFSTTVLGLVIGGIAYSIMHIRIRWQRKDLYFISKLAEEKLISRLEQKVETTHLHLL